MVDAQLGLAGFSAVQCTFAKIINMLFKKKSKFLPIDKEWLFRILFFLNFYV